MEKNFFYNKFDAICAFIFICLFITIVEKNLLVGFFAALLSYELSNLLAMKINHKKARFMSVLTVGAVALSLVSGFFWGAISFLTSGEKLSLIMYKMATILDEVRVNEHIPPLINKYIPDNINELNNFIISWLNSHATEAAIMGEGTVKVFIYIILGIIIGLLIAFHIELDRSSPSFPTQHFNKPVAEWFGYHLNSFRYAVKSVIFAQAKISAINSLLTWVYLCLLLPYVFGVKLPFALSLVLLTFSVGLIPVAGNLISNTVIVIISLSVSIYVALGSLIYLIIIHKLEYFINAKIIGDKINAKPYELLISMLLFERVFGLQGVLLAPICWAYIKYELMQRELI